MLDNITPKNGTIGNISERIGFVKGFQKAMELMGDKKFSEEDIRKGFEAGYETLASDKTYNEHYDKLIQSLQQTEFDVEIEMEDIFVKNNEQYVDEVGIGNYSTHSKKPKLDKDGCLILRKNII